MEMENPPPAIVVKALTRFYQNASDDFSCQVQSRFVTCDAVDHAQASGEQKIGVVDRVKALESKFPDRSILGGPVCF